MNKPKLPYKIFKKSGLLYFLSFFLFFAIVFSSCKVPQNAYYFKTLKRDTTINVAGKGMELKIQKNDLLMVNISSLNKDEDIVYNAPSASLGGTSSMGYLVDGGGNIQLHKLGLVHVEGMTRTTLKEKIQKDISPYLKDPVVTVRYLNHKITVLGEVVKPQVIPMPEEHLSLLEVLGASGDVSILARRDNILIIRETGNGKEFKRINLEDHSIFSSQWYWLQPDDVVYVEPNDVKLHQEKNAKRQQNISIALSAASVAIIILFKFIK